MSDPMVSALVAALPRAIDPGSDAQGAKEEVEINTWFLVRLHIEAAVFVAERGRGHDQTWGECGASNSL